MSKLRHTGRTDLRKGEVMNRGQKLGLLRQLQEVFPRMEYGDYSWKLNGQLILETIPNLLYRDLFRASYRIGGGSPWHGFRVARWRRCHGCPLLHERRWLRQKSAPLPQPELDFEPDGTQPAAEQWERVEAACFFRCLVHRIEEVMSTPVTYPGLPTSLREVPVWLRQMRDNRRWLRARRRAWPAFQDWRKDVEAALSPEPCQALRTQPGARAIPGSAVWQQNGAVGERERALSVEPLA